MPKGKSTRTRAKRQRNVDPLRPQIRLIKSTRKRRKTSPAQKAARKFFKSAVATLKRKGLIPRAVDARKAKPTKALRKKITQFAGVIEGQEKAYTLPKDFPKAALRALKSQGYKVHKGKLILPKGQYFRKPSQRDQAKGATGVRVKPQSNRPGGHIHTIKIGPDLETEIRKVFAAKKPGEYIGFQIYGNSSLSIFDNAQSLLNQLLGYKGIEDGTIEYITIFKTSDPDTYLKERTVSHQQARRTLRARERRAMRKGMRVSRGH